MKALLINPILVPIFLFALLCCSMPDVVSAQKALRDAPVNETRVTIEFYPKGEEAEKTNPIVLSFNGTVYTELPLLGTDQNLQDAEKFLTKAIVVNRSDSLDEIAALWNPKERQALRSLASDPRLLDANRKFYSTISKSYLKAKIHYGTYVILVIKHLDTVSGVVWKDYPIKKIGSEYFLTNELQEDPVFQYLTTKYIRKLREQ